MRSFVVARFTLTLALASLPTPSAAGWLPYGNPVVTEPTNQWNPQIASDGAGGIILVWEDSRQNSSYRDLYAQRLDEDGTPLWTTNGVPICTHVGDASAPTIVSDGAGGAIIAWHDNRVGALDIHAQRVGPDGARLWTTDGIALCNLTNQQQWPRAVSDGAGGAIVTWEDYRFGSTNSSIYAQRVDASGTPLWAVQGALICSAPNNQLRPELLSDGLGGAIVAWEDFRQGGFGDIYARRVSAAGVVQWDFNGVALCTATGHQGFPMLTSDGAGGAIVAWVDDRSAPLNNDIFVRRIDAGGVVHWAADGVAVCSAPGSRRHQSLVPDGAGGAIIAWADYRSAASYDLYAQRIDGSGARAWAPNGLMVCAEQDDQTFPAVASDGQGGAIVAWQDHRSPTWYGDIYAARLTDSGSVLWVDAVCTLDWAQLEPVVLDDAQGGVFFAWMDARLPATNGDIYAAHWSGSGPTTDAPTPTSPRTVELSAATPNPSAGAVAFELRLAESGDARLELFHVSGRREATHELRGLSAGSHRVVLDGLGVDGRPLATGVYLVRVRTAHGHASRRISVIR